MGARRQIAKERLLEIFRTRIIALGHDMEWPPLSPDLTPCDHLLWGHLKNKVYATPPINVDIYIVNANNYK